MVLLMEEIWTEKYRPKKLSEVIGQESITKALGAFLQSKNLPHCLFSGPAGCGKTTTALCIAHELYGTGVRGNFLELNASDERGIDVIRDKVKEFARQQTAFGSSFRIVYLDEADALTKDAQHALRRTMENYSHICRFILACNYSGKIIHPIQSRTAVFRFSSLREEDVIKYLKHIAVKEALHIDEDAFRALFRVSEGDLRKAINILQLAATHKKITEDVIYTVTNRADPEAVKKMIETSLAGRFREARSQLLDLLNNRGLAGEDLIKEIHSQIFSLDIPDLQKLQLIEKVGEYEFRLTEGSNPQVQLEAMLAQFALLGKK
jgi:replication factor C small subunit